MSTFSVYIVINTLNGKKYVGITGGTVAARWRAHRKTARRGATTVFAKALRKYQPSAFICEHVACSVSWEDACATESIVIAQEKSFISEHGYNATRGGEGVPGVLVCAETRAKLSAAHKNREFSESHRTALSEANKRRYQEFGPPVRSGPSPLLGIKRDRAPVEAMRAKLKGRKRDARAVAATAAAHRGMKRSPEFCAKMRARKVSEETKLKLRQIAIEQFQKNGHPRSGKKRTAAEIAKMKTNQIASTMRRNGDAKLFNDPTALSFGILFGGG